MHFYIVFEVQCNWTQTRPCVRLQPTLELGCSHLTDTVFSAHRYKTVEFIPKGLNPSSIPRKDFRMTTAIYLFFFKVSPQEGGEYSSLPLSLPAVAWTTNWHPVFYPGVHAEARPVPAEHLSGPVPAAAPQEGPHTAQVHWGWHVRVVSDKTKLQLTRGIGWDGVATRKKRQKTWSDHLFAVDLYLYLALAWSDLTWWGSSFRVEWWTIVWCMANTVADGLTSMHKHNKLLNALMGPDYVWMTFVYNGNIEVISCLARGVVNAMSNRSTLRMCFRC